ncbi:unnamed protein product [Bursaphelenchus xylophilus]|uniref:(pine wood nematode) hypothetical protein n=1 Tax=Bursaphelenchus xylophilus TaxID=6326 RepID=A0A1I7SDA9_BURXY|nr:unnamed protein product [Bursaphelenchus xylophilus]CAG9130569.1 unnamed protein product [Bursaphelenchus xylophilus]
MIPKAPDWRYWTLLFLFAHSSAAVPVKRQVSLDDLIHTALSFVKPIFDTTRPIHESPGIVKKSPYDTPRREVAVLGAPTFVATSDAPICQGNSQICKFISCTAHNFKYDESFANLNLAAQLIQDKKMRKVISQNPEAVTSVCREQGLSHDQCKMFSKGFQLIDRFMNSIEKPVEENTTSEPLTNVLEPINDSPEPIPDRWSSSLPLGSHTWSTRVKNIETKTMRVGRGMMTNQTQTTMRTTNHKTPPLGAVTPSTKGISPPRARNPRPAAVKYTTGQSLKKPALPIPRPITPNTNEDNEYEDNDLLEDKERPRRQRSAEYYDEVSQDTTSSSIIAPTQQPGKKLNCIQYLRDLT